MICSQWSITLIDRKQQKNILQEFSHHLRSTEHSYLRHINQLSALICRLQNPVVPVGPVAEGRGAGERKRGRDRFQAERETEREREREEEEKADRNQRWLCETKWIQPSPGTVYNLCSLTESEAGGVRRWECAMLWEELLTSCLHVQWNLFMLELLCGSTDCSVGIWFVDLLRSWNNQDAGFYWVGQSVRFTVLSCFIFGVFLWDTDSDCKLVWHRDESVRQCFEVWH